MTPRRSHLICLQSGVVPKFVEVEVAGGCSSGPTEAAAVTEPIIGHHFVRHRLSRSSAGGRLGRSVRSHSARLRESYASQYTVPENPSDCKDSDMTSPYETVFVGGTRVEAAIVVALLNANGIEGHIWSDDVGETSPDLAYMNGVVVVVAQNVALKAQRLIEAS